MNTKKEIIGFTAGVFDMFHIGHLNLLRNAKALCDTLIVGLNIDAKYKNKPTFIPYRYREEIVRGCKYVDLVIPLENNDKLEAWKRLKFNVLFVGDDWYNDDKWKDLELRLKEVGVKIIYFPYTKETSSTILKEQLLKELDESKETFEYTSNKKLEKNES